MINNVWCQIKQAISRNILTYLFFQFDTISSYKSGESFVTCTEESALTEGGESQALLTPACFFSPISPDQ